MNLFVFILFLIKFDVLKYEETHIRQEWRQADKQQMINEWKQRYRDKFTRRKIDEFISNYSIDEAVRWYGDDTIVYRSINEALRSNQINEILKYRFYLVDLYEQLKTLHNEQMEYMIELSLWRGQKMFKKDLELLQLSIGRLITMKNFLSTSVDQEIALGFLLGCFDMEDDDLVLVLFEIIIDPTVRSQPFAYISGLTHKPESEFLFSMGSVFRIESVQFNSSNKIWNIRLISSEENEDLRNLIDYYKKLELDRNLGETLYQMGEYDAAIQHCQWELAPIFPMNKDIASLYRCIGICYKEKGEYKQSLSYHKLAVKNTFRKYNDIPLVLSIIQSIETYPIALCYCGQKRYHAAIYLLHQTMNGYILLFRDKIKDLNTEEQYRAIELEDVSKVYISLGSMYSGIKDFHTSATDLTRALESRTRSLPSNHYYLGLIHFNFGDLYQNAKQWELALEHYKLALKICAQSRVSLISRISNKIGNVYEKKNGLFKCIGILSTNI